MIKPELQSDENRIELRNSWRRAGLKMKALMRKQIWLFIVFMILILSCVETGFAKDRLFLTGVVRSVDSSSGTLRINVTSEGCKGTRDFRAPEDGTRDLDASLVGKTIQFYIDSAICEQGRVHNILSERLP